MLLKNKNRIWLRKKLKEVKNYNKKEKINLLIELMFLN